MARDISIAISARDNFTQAITTMRNANMAFNKDLTGLQSKLDALNKNKITLKVETDKAKSALKEAEKQFIATGSAADKMKMELAHADHESAAGAVVGAGLGVINGLTSLYTAKDEAFKSAVQESYNKAKQEQADILSTGITIAGSREQKQISFTTLLGSEEAARDYLAEMTDFASRTPFQYDQLANISKTMLAYGYKVDELIPELTRIGDAGSALGMSAEDMNFVATSLGRMRTTGKTALEYLNHLLERGIPVWDYLAKASGKTKEQVQEMVSKGLVPGAEAAKAISDYMGKEFAGNIEKQSKTYQGLVSTLQDAKDAMAAAMGEGYNEERKKGLEAEINWLRGTGGEKMKEANRIIGEWKASLDNEREAAIREAVETMMASEEYKEAAERGERARMGALLAKAQIEGENKFRASEGYQLQLKADLDLARSIREDTSLKEEYWNAGYVMGKEFSKGRMAGASSREGLGYNENATGFDFPGYAYGINYVPYDNFPALLHQGEKVLTASEARAANSGTSVTITANSFVVREEADIEKIAREICRQVKIAVMLS